jgi:hypothetical protein
MQLGVDAMRLNRHRTSVRTACGTGNFTASANSP